MPTTRQRWLLALPAAGLLWPPVYNRHDPEILGVPFFYAYQLLMILLAAVCMILVERHQTRRDHADPP